MPSKKEFEDIFNKLLGTNIKWSKLSKEELVQLAVLFNNPEILVKRLGGRMGEDIVKSKLVDILLELTRGWEGPLLKSFRRMFEE